MRALMINMMIDFRAILVYLALTNVSIHAFEGGSGEFDEPINSLYDDYDMHEDYYDPTVGKLCHVAILNE